MALAQKRAHGAQLDSASRRQSLRAGQSVVAVQLCSWKPEPTALVCYHVARISDENRPTVWQRLSFPTNHISLGRSSSTIAVARGGDITSSPQFDTLKIAPFDSQPGDIQPHLIAPDAPRRLEEFRHFWCGNFFLKVHRAVAKYFSGRQTQQINIAKTYMSGVQPRTAAKRISSACGSCKKGKCKCSGPPAPCESCARKGRECVFEVALDGRRKESAKAALDAIKSKHDALESLFNCLQSGNDDAVLSLVNAIRKGSKLPELEKVVEKHQENVGARETEEVIAGPSRQANTDTE
ncbi:hypothetical protein TWF730_003675 [Orbilia blumenaviensis]|uniref:Zn(2)-C6 fungal-type domain-containing protein n=1 Tax=Orbilia blumenaviensis TaxID=1796055 RepID=A0AAV9U6C3_9PEZI